MRRLIDTCNLSAEITGISMVILGLSNQLDDEETDVLTPSAMKDALFGVSAHLDRIAVDLGNASRNETETKGAGE